MDQGGVAPISSWLPAPHLIITASIKMATTRSSSPPVVKNTWGGRRPGAGRKPIPGRPRPTPHRERPHHDPAIPVLVSWRAVSGFPSLRSPRAFPAVRAAVAAAAKPGFRIIQFSVAKDHLYLLCEARDTASLSRGIRGVTIRAARGINNALERSGAVWGDRYFSRPLPTPRDVRNALVAMLLGGPKPGTPNLCSSAPWFDGFRDRNPAASEEAPPVAPAKTPLATTGWRKLGLLAFDEAPEPRASKS